MSSGERSRPVLLTSRGTRVLLQIEHMMESAGVAAQGAQPRPEASLDQRNALTLANGPQAVGGN
jgi:hypothetical protein